MRKRLMAIIFIFLVLSPIGAYAQTNFIPCDGVQVPCGFRELMMLIERVLSYLVMISYPLAIISISWAGFILMTTGVSDKRSFAKSILIKVVIGFAILLASWLIVKSALKVLLRDDIIEKIPISFPR